MVARNAVSVEGNAVHAGSACHRLGAIGTTIAIIVLQHDDIADVTPCGIENSAVGNREHARVHKLARENVNGKTVRSL